MGGTKGSHIVLDHPELLAATGGREIFFEHSDGRIVLIYPLKDRVLVGTTDIDADPSRPVVCTDDEVSYFFDLIHHVFPKIQVDREQIVYTFSGIRPLPRHDETLPGFVSRDYRIERDRLGAVPMLSLVGGKWTTFRALGEHMADEALGCLGLQRRVSTTSLSIGGGEGYPVDARSRMRWLAEHSDGHDHGRVSVLLDRYGTRAVELLDVLPELDAELAELPGYSEAELAHLAATEQVVHLDDLLLRRTSIAFVGGLSDERVRAAARAVAPVLGWDDAAVAAEVERTIELLRNAHRIDPQKGGSFIAG